MLKPDLISLLIGLVAGILIAVLLKRPYLRSILKKKKLKEAKSTGTDRNDELFFRKKLLREVESLHLLSFFCRLSDLHITQKLISNPLYIDQSIDVEEVPELFRNPLAIGEIPEISLEYPFPVILLSEALSGSNNILIKGRIGSGKTTLIASLIIEILEGRCPVAELNHVLPLYVHVRDLNLSGAENNFEDLVINGLVRRNVINKKSSFEEILQKYRTEKRLLFCIDGLDELLPDDFDTLASQINNYQRQNPSVQMVATSGPFYSGGLQKAGFIPFYLKPASLEDNKNLVKKISEIYVNDIYHLENDIVREWLKRITPSGDLFTSTLQIFGYLYPVPGPRDSFLEPYIRFVTDGRLTTSNLISIAGELFKNKVNNSPSFEKLEMGSNDLRNNGMSIAGNSGETILKSLLEKKVLISSQDGDIEFSKTDVYCHLLSMSGDLTPDIKPERLLRSPFEDRILQLTKQTNYLENWLTKTTQIEDIYLLLTLEHLINKDNKKAFGSSVIEKLARIIASPGKPLSVRYITAVIIYLAEPNILLYLFRHMLTSPDVDTSHLILLLAVYTGDTKFATLLSQNILSEYVLLRDLALFMLIKYPNNDRSSLIDFEMHSLAGNNTGEIMAFAGDEGKRLLLEYAHDENPNCRRNAVAGLKKINEAWAYNELHRINSTDSQWMVRDAAAQAIENHWNQAIYIPRKLPALEKNPEIIQFVEENKLTTPISGSPVQVITFLIESHDYLKQLLGLRYLLKLGGPQKDSMVSSLCSHPGQLREVATKELHELNYDKASLGSKVS